MKKELGFIASTICILLAASCSANNAQSTNTAATVSAAAEVSESAVTSPEVLEDTTTTTTTAETTTTTTTTTTAATTTTATTEEPFVVETVTIAGDQYQTDVLELDLSSKTLSDQDIENLAKCKKLKSLNLEWTSVDGSGDDVATIVKAIDSKFDFLSDFKDIEKIVLPFGVSFSHIKNLTNLQYLKITSMEMVINKLDLNDLKNLKNLKELYLGGMNHNRHMNNDISGLNNIEKLEILAIYDAYSMPYESEEQVNVLCKLKNLKKLYVGDMSAENIQKIQDALPNCVIARDEY